MFSTRRLAKRSIVGTRVSAPWTDGRFYAGVIQATQTWPNGEDVYTVLFDDGFTKTFRDKEIIGPGFQTICRAALKPKQKVFITHNGREVRGVVIKHDFDNDEVDISVRNGSDDLAMTRKLEDVRLLESRKSARLQDVDTDYSRMADFPAAYVAGPEMTKKRAVSSVIDVPALVVKPRRKNSSSPDNEEEDMTSGDIMDEHMAAMVLTSLSTSPLSTPPGMGGRSSNSFFDKGESSPGGGAASSIGSSGVWGMKGEPATPSPPHFQGLSTSAPVSGVVVFGSQFPPDEGVELDDPYFDPDDGGPRKRKASSRTVYKCTWPGCEKISNTCPTIEMHVRQAHLGPREDNEDDLSDHEEEFYYAEIEATVGTVTQTFADMHTSSPPQGGLSPRVAMGMVQLSLDHDYQKKDHKSAPLNIPKSVVPEHFDFVSPGSSFPKMSGPPLGGISKSWQSTMGNPAVKTSRSYDRLGPISGRCHSLSTSPKSSPMHKKIRSEVKKCRKVYGMENRDLWCTQCKWKKACTRFMES